MTAGAPSQPAWSETDVEHALLDGALRDLGAVLGDEQALRLFLTEATFNVAVTALLRTGWWPHSADIETRRKWAAEQELAVELWDQLRRMPITIPVELLS